MSKRLSRIHGLLMPGGVPLAWRQLTGDKKRFAAALAGVSFGVVLMLFQLGIFEAFMVMVIRPIEAMRGDIAVVSRGFQYIMSTGEFTERRLYQALSLPEVEEVYPVMIAYMNWREPETGRISEMGVFGVHPGRNPFTIPEVADRSDVLTLSDGMLFDDRSSPDLGDVAGLLSRLGEVATEINKRRIRVLGLFSMGETLGVYGHGIMGTDAFQRLSGQHADVVQLGMITVKPDANPEAVARELDRILPEDVQVLTRQELIRKEQVYWQENTPVGFIVVAGMVIAMVVGSIIVYQILYTDINDHQKEYATLKAIGLGNDFFLRFILSESLILLIFGFAPGMLISSLLFRLAETEAGMPTRLTFSGTTIVFGLSAVMCMAAGLFATRRLRTADPADIF